MDRNDYGHRPLWQRAFSACGYAVLWTVTGALLVATLMHTML